MGVRSAASRTSERIDHAGREEWDEHGCADHPPVGGTHDPGLCRDYLVVVVALNSSVLDFAEFHVDPADELVFFVHCGDGVFAVGQVFGVEFDGAGGVELRPGDTDWFLSGVSRVDV